MNENEELLTATELAGTDEQAIDLDDVEGHGLREVAAGLGAAAVLAGAGTAAAAVADVHPSLPGVAHAQVSVDTHDPVGTSDHAVDSGISATRAVRDASLRLASTEVTASTDAAANTVSASETVAANAVRATGHITSNAVTATHNVARATTDVAFETTSHVGSTAGRTVQGTTSTANATTTSVSATTARKTATVLSVTSNAVSATTTTLTMTVAELNPQAGTGASASDMSGWVSIQIGGVTLAQVQVVDGQATISLDTKDIVGKSMSFVYSGDSIHASSTRTLTVNL